MNFILPFILAFGCTLIFTYVWINLAKRYNILDDPKKHKHPAILHKKAVPTAGGLAIYLGFFLAALLVMPFSQRFLGILLGGLVLVILGALDDKYDLRNSVKFFAQILAALIVVASGIGISYITNPFFSFGQFGQSLGVVIRLDNLRVVFDFLGTHSIVVFADLFALFWIVWVINMVNFSAGVDGQMPGIVLVTLIVIFAASLRFYPADSTQLIVTRLSLVGAGTTLAFLFFNYYPAKIFPGDSGSYFLGFLVAVLAILSGAKVGTAILVMAVPLIDGVFTVFRRVLAGKSPFRGDRKHLHHRLLELGFSERQVALFYWLLCAILGTIALMLSSVEKVFAGAIVTIVVLGGLVWLNMSLPEKAQG